MLTRNGSCVIAIANSRAGSSGARRRHGEEKGSPIFPSPLPLSVASAAVVVMAELLLDRSRCDLLTLAERGRVLRRTRDHAREELRAPVADVLELRDAEVLHAR